MGFVRSKTYRLTFADDTEYAGLEARFRAPSIDELLKVAELADALAAGGRALIDGVGEIVDAVSDGLIEWNLETEDGTPVPTDRAGVGTIDRDMLGRLLREWTKAAAGVSPPLPEPSTSGEGSGVASLPMETLSPSPVS
jgi:hypothetical protein